MKYIEIALDGKPALVEITDIKAVYSFPRFVGQGLTKPPGVVIVYHHSESIELYADDIAKAYDRIKAALEVIE